MTTKDSVVKQATTWAEKGFLCSESVLLAVSSWLQIRSELIPKIATGFGAGVGGCGSVCGAISGGVMALGIKFGRSDPIRQMRAPYWFARELFQRFEKEFGHTECCDLTGCDLTTEAGRKKYADERLWETKCKQYIGTTTAMVLDVISEKP